MLATIAIGEQYLQPFMKYAYHTWEMYCHRHDLGLILFDEDLISPDHPKWKKATWQKYIIADVVSESDLGIENVCYLDTDILISPIAPNIFNEHKLESVSVVSQFFNMPFGREEALRRIAFFRNRFFSKDYPLDSILFATLDQLASFSNLPPQPNYACSGLFVFNVAKLRSLLSEFFFSYDREILTPTDGGDELYFNYFVQSNKLDNWLNYRYQSLWIYEVAMNYPFLYNIENVNLSLVKKCIEASLLTNHFLHFAGSWNESLVWKQVKVCDNPESLDIYASFEDYLKTPVYGKPIGTVKPKEIS